MIKNLRYLCTLLLIAVASAAWGDEETFSYSNYQGQGTQSSGSEVTMSGTNVSITNTKFYCSTNYNNAQFYANGTTTITPLNGVTITQVVLTASDSNYNGSQSGGTITASTGSVSSSGITVTWTGSATSAFTLTNNKQIRWTSIVVTYTASGGPTLNPSDLVLTGSPIALTFDLYNNSNAQVINYTTSSTGAITVSESDFVETLVDATNKTITVTPKAVTSSAQTIAVSQAADNTYTYGFTTFTVSVDDSTPFTGSYFIFNSDEGLSELNITKPESGSGTDLEIDEDYTIGSVTMNITNGSTNTRVWNSNGNTDLRVYNGGTLTFTVPVGYAITKVTFEGSSVELTGVTGKVWTASSNPVNTVTFTNGSTASKITTIKVEYESNSSPMISADDVNLDFNATSGSIAYTLTNEVTGGTLSAATTSDWLTVGALSNGTIALSCLTNGDAAPRTATVILTYTYGNNQTITKEVMVTQTGNPNVFDNISDISEVGTAYGVKGTVVATNARGLVLGDGTGYVYYYKNAAVTQSVGDIISISGTTGTYGHIIQFTNTATVETATESNYNHKPAATVITEVPNYTQDNHLSTYLEFEGTLNKSNSSYYIAVGEGQIQISYPTTEQGTALTALADKTVHVKGYFAGINSSDKFTVMLESIEEVAGTDPVINAENVTLAYDANSGEIAYTIENSVDGTSLTAALKESAEWISDIAVTSEKVTFTTTANEGNADRTATITLTYGEVSKEVSVTQKHLVVDYATLPFAYDGNGSGTLPLGLTQNGVGTYNTSPAMKFDETSDWLILKFNEQPGKLTFDIKGNSFSGGTFTVQTSEDGLTYNNLETYTELGATQNKVFDNLGENVRYIKWIYTEKVNGNVALGNIRLEKPGQVSPPVISANNVTIAADATSGEISYSIANPVDGVGLTATTDAEWISTIAVSSEKITFTTTANEGEIDRIATFILKYEGAEDKKVTVTQKHVVADIAGLPFEFDGGRADIANTAGLTHEGLDTDYGSSPKLKFNTTGDYLLLHFNGQPGKLTFAIKGNSFSGGTFKVQTSADGETFTDLETYTTLNETQSEEFNNLSADARYIKWVYTEKVDGNVALGLIKLEKPSNDPIITAEDVTIEANATSGEIAYTITNPIEGTTLSASTDTEWISNIVVDEENSVVNFNITANEGDERTCVITLSYGSLTKDVTITQAKYIEVGEDKYELVTDASILKANDEILIAYVDEDGAFVMGEQTSNNRKAVEATDNHDGTITPNSNAQVVKLEGNAQGWYFNVDTGYLYAAGGNTNNYLRTETEIDQDGNAMAIISIEDNDATIVFQGTSERNLVRFNPNSSNKNPLFSCYASTSTTGSLPQIYRKVTSTETLLGDVNGDKKVDVADVTALVNLLLNESVSHNPKDHPAANLDEDEDLDAEDVRALVEKVLSEE